MRTKLLTLVLLLVGITECHADGENASKSQNSVSAVQATQAGGWQDFKSTEGKFSVSMPGDPIKQTLSVPTKLGKINAYMFIVKKAPVTYIATYSDYPAAAVQGANKKTMLDGARDGSVANVRGKLLNEKVISIGQHPGRDLTIDVPQFKKKLRQRIILVDNRMYQLLVEAGDVKKIAGDVDKFFSSFKLLGQ